MSSTTDTDADTLRRLYHDEGLSQSDIADRLGCSQATISRRFAEYDIATPATGGPAPQPRRISLGRDPYRWACPRGHVSLHRRRTDAAAAPFYCNGCRQADHDPHYTAAELVDRKQQARDDDGGWPDP